MEARRGGRDAQADGSRYRCDGSERGPDLRFLANAGIRQFLDLGTGLPSQNNVHEVAQRVSPDARVVYVDNDPVVLDHAEALPASDEQERARPGGEWMPAGVGRKP